MKKEEKGITLIALVVTIVVLLILAGVSISMLTGEKGIINQAMKAKEENAKAELQELVDLAITEWQTRENSGENITIKKVLDEKVGKEFDSVALEENNQIKVIKGNYSVTVDGSKYSNIVEPDGKVNAEKQIDTTYGRIDVVWIDTNNKVISSPNEPKLTSEMTKVTWTKSGDTWTEDETAKSEWYNYTAGTGNEDNLESMWANVKIDGSYFVWIPRYAYRISYYSDEACENLTAYYDGYGMWSVDDGTIKYEIDDTLETVTYNGYKYIVHPAFMNDTANTYEHGGWDSDLTGIWVGKYEVSGSPDALKVVPNVSSLRDMTIGEQYTAAINYNSNLLSHMMKNSEWGTVAYLTHSQYGRNGYEIDINNSSDFITGNGGGSPTANSASGTTNAYNTTTGAKASTTGNVYGIYDISGGAWERLATFNSVDARGDFDTFGWTTATGLTPSSNSTKFATKYNNKTGINVGTETELEISKIGDALIEVNKKIGKSSTSEEEHWFGDYSHYTYNAYPFFHRGGNYENGVAGGTLYSSYTNGYSNSSDSFRVCLIL